MTAPLACLPTRDLACPLTAARRSEPVARSLARPLQPAAPWSPGQRPTSAQLAACEGTRVPFRDRRRPSHQAWPLARQSSQDVWCAPLPPRLEVPAPLARGVESFSRFALVGQRD